MSTKLASDKQKKCKGYDKIQMNLDCAKQNLYEAINDLGNGTDAGELITNLAEQINRVQQIIARVYYDDTYNILGGLDEK